MSDLPPRYYCPLCEAPIPTPNFAPSGNAKDATCPSCQSSLSQHELWASAVILFCVDCRGVRVGQHAQHPADPDANVCARCGCAYVAPIFSIRAPLTPHSIRHLADVIAHRLVTAGMRTLLPPSGPGHRPLLTKTRAALAEQLLLSALNLPLGD